MSTAERKPGTPAVGFWLRVDQSGDCWNWTGPLDPDGYGKFWDGMRYHMAHRFAFMSCVETLRDHREIDHLCRNRACVNPEHLEQVTSRTNTLRGTSPAAMNAIKTQCKRGHEFTPENTIIKQRCGRIARACRRCKNDQTRARRLISGYRFDGRETAS